MNAFQFNAFAIVVLVVVMPFAVAFISNGGNVEGASYEDGIDIYEPGLNPSGFWFDNGGKNWSSQYSGMCAHVVDQVCTDTGAANYFFLANAANARFTPAQSLTVPDTHFMGSNQGSDPYVGNSGDGPFTWYFAPNFFNAMPNNQAFDKLRWTFVDLNRNFNCNSHTWVNLTIEYDVIFEHDGEELLLEGFIEDTSNRYKHVPYPHYHEQCNVGFDLVMDFSAFESIQLNDFNDGFWNETNTTLTIKEISREDGFYLTNTEIPFAGTDDFQISLEYSAMDPTKANFFIRMGTLALSVLTFALAIASTPYWDPFKNVFRGIQ